MFVGAFVVLIQSIDDIALPDAKYKRGIAGTLFVHKIAGAAAARGESLAEVAAAARDAADAVASIGMAMESCQLPFEPVKPALGENELEIALGIHGERGVERVSLQSCRALVSLISARLRDSMRQKGLQPPFAMLVNNLGGGALSVAKFSTCV